MENFELTKENSNKLIILGFDGVMFETNIYHLLAWKKTMKLVNRYVDDKHIFEIAGLSRIKSLEYFIKKFELNLNTQEKNEMLKENEKHFKKYIENLTETDLPPTILELIHWLRAGGYKVSLLPNSKFVIDLLTKFDMLNLFDYVPSKDVIDLAENDIQEIIHSICENLDVKQYNTILIDASQQSLDVASSMLLRTIGISRGRKLFGVLEQLQWVDELTVDKVSELLSKIFISK